MQEHLERRKYIRLTSVFPVTFQFFLSGQPDGKLYQGFTRNISSDGLCIEINDLDEQAKENLRNPQSKLRLAVNMPLSTHPSWATAKIAWVKTQKDSFPTQYLIGVHYEDIQPKVKKRIFAYARRVRNLPRYAGLVAVILIALTAFSLVDKLKARRDNRLLVEKTVQLADRHSRFEQKIFLANSKEEELKDELRGSFAREEEFQKRMSVLQELIGNTEQAQQQRLNNLLVEQQALKDALSQLQLEKSALDRQLAQLLKEKDSLTTDLLTIEKESRGLKRSALENMYRWLKVHQAHSTGLLTSFEGDRSLRNWAFTYDQSLAAQVFTLFGDYERARRVFDFYKYKAKKINGGFANAFEVNRGKVAEYAVHSGPNIWLGIAIMQYTNKSGDRQYLKLARSIGDWVISIQEQDEEFGIRGGPDVRWFSTEHNLDAYALFNMLYAVTQDKAYQLASQRTLAWLEVHAYNGTDSSINRGKGDATIATDTFSWAISSLGPELLIQSQMDPEQIIQYAEKNCLVEVDYQRPEGDVVKVSGFDFSRYTHLPRGGIISTEWTAQMIVAYQVMATYFSQQGVPDKADFYRQKADFYLNELSKMLTSSPSKVGQGEGCLPYASATNADTGHGWRTPEGKNTGSVAGTAYTIFASMGYNPLSFSQTK